MPLTVILIFQHQCYDFNVLIIPFSGNPNLEPASAEEIAKIIASTKAQLELNSSYGDSSSQVRNISHIVNERHSVRSFSHQKYSAFSLQTVVLWGNKLLPVA
jgi:hypothetical protein